MADNTYGVPAEGSAGHKIDKDELLVMARAYRNERLDLISKYGDNQKDSRSCYYTKDIFERILKTDCSGIRIYYGVRTEPSDGKQYTTLVLAGVKVDPTTGKEELVKLADEVEDDAIFEYGSLCPPGECSATTLLNEIDEA